MTHWNGNWSYDIPGPGNIGIVEYFIWANDTTGNTEMTPVYQIQILDVTKPEITHTPITSGTTGDAINITAQVTDDVAVDSVYLSYTDVSGANHNVSMNRWEDNWSYDIPGQNPTGPVNYFIWANDTCGNANMTQEFQIQIYDDDNPVADAGPDQSVNEDEVVYFDGGGSTDNVGITWYNWTYGDGSYDFGANVTTNHTYTNAGNYIVTLNVSDAVGNWATDTCFVFVSNIAPIANAGGNKTGNEGEAITFNGSASVDTQSDNSTLSYVWYFGDGNSQAGKMVNHVYADNGTYTATLVVTDDNGGVDSDTVVVTVYNLAPVITSVADQAAQQGVQFTLKINATDVPADILVFSDNTTLFNINPVTGIIQFTPTNSVVGVHFVRVTVTDDDGGSNSITFNITVLNMNDPPAMQSIPSQTATEDVPFTLQVTATDPDVGDTLAYSLTDYPAGMTIDPSTGLISWTPTNSDVGSHAVTVRVRDAGGLYDEETFVITVANVNDPPTIITASLPNATEGVTYLCSIQANDIDVGQVLTFSLDFGPSFLSVDSTNGLLYGMPTKGDVGVHQIIVNVSDGTTFVTRTFNLTVLNVNDLPTIKSYPVTIAKPGAEYIYTVIAEDTDIGDVLTYSLVAAPEGMTINNQTGRVAWTPTDAQAGQTYQVVVQVSDGHGSTTQAFSIVVDGLPTEPYRPFFDNYVWIGIVLLLVTMIILMSLAVRNERD